MNAQQIADRIVNKSGSYQEVMSYAEGMIAPLIKRAEAAEARAADAEIRAKSWHDLAMTLAEQRAEAAEARAEYAETLYASAEKQRHYWFTRFNEISTERDNAINRAEAAEALSNTYTGTIDTLVKEKAQAEALAATLQGELNKALAQIAKLDRETRYFQSTDYAADRHLKQFEQTAPVDWREAKQQDDDWDHDTGDLTNDELSDELEP